MSLTDHIERAADSAYAWAFAACAFAGLVPLWSVAYPPMVDLPQHAAQVFLWQHFDDPAYGLESLYQIELFKPYFLGYALARLFAEIFGVVTGLKIVLSLYLLGLPLSIDRLLFVTRSQRWGALLGFPLAYGFAFHWGFFVYLVALPITVLFLAEGWRHAHDPTPNHGVFLGVFAFVLYFCHAIAFGFAMAAVALLCVATAGHLPTRLRRLLPLLPASIAVAIWSIVLHSGDPRAGGELAWTEGPWQRLVDLPALLLGGAMGSGETPLAYRLGGLALLLLSFALGQLSPSPARRALPLLVSLGFYLALPNRLLGAWFVYPRLAVFVPVTLLLLFPLFPADSARAGLRRRAGRILVVSFVILWSAWLTREFRAFDREARGMRVVLEHMEPHRDVLGLIFDPGYDLVAGLPVFGHFHAWYSAEKGGTAESSFASAYPQYVVQYRDGRTPRTRPLLAMRPDLFDWQEDGDMDYFLVRSERDLGPRLFHDAGGAVELLVRSGDWWVYERVDRETEGTGK